jgi:hypothetical protein
MKTAQMLSIVIAAVAIAGCATTGGSANPLVGTWNFTVESQLGTMEQVVTVMEDMTGVVTTVEPPSEINVTNFAYADGAVTFDIVFDIEGTELPAKFVGTLDGDEITGEYVTDLGNGTVMASRAG